MKGGPENEEYESEREKDNEKKRESSKRGKKLVNQKEK